MYIKKAEYIASYIIERRMYLNNPIQNRNLQLILYFIQESFINEFNEKAFFDSIWFWRFGPVVPNVYYKYCSYGALPIIFNSKPKLIGEFTSNNSKEKVKLINKIIDDSLGKDLWLLLEQYEKNDVVYKLQKT